MTEDGTKTDIRVRVTGRASRRMVHVRAEGEIGVSATVATRRLRDLVDGVGTLTVDSAWLEAQRTRVREADQ